jgi:acetyl-CoA C-acetyltransferase
MENVYILGGLRSHIGIKNGIFKNVLPEKLGAHVLKNLISIYNLHDIDEIICGNAVGTGGNITRLMSLYAGVSEEVPAYTVDMQCGSGSMSIDMAFAKIRSGMCNLIIAGGFESISLQPLRYYNKNDPRYSNEKPYFQAAQFSPYEVQENAMLMGAERVAQKYNIKKEELDFWVLQSHERAVKARNIGILNDIICSINECDHDEGIRDSMRQSLIDRLKPLVGENGVITAVNSCLTNDGAAFVILCSERYIKNNNIKPKAQIVETALKGANPLHSPESSIIVTDKLLKSRKMEYSDISAFEFNEAFAVIDVMFQRKNPRLIDRYNILGGALAYGHPYGASGAIIMLHLLKSLEYVDGEYGLTAIAAAGGIGSSILIKRS